MTSRQFSTNTRNVCILAHVDHGKTTFADSLLAANNILSTRMAGKIRYLDARDDEQERGITMEASAVSLNYRRMQRSSQTGEPKAEDFVINLIDSPGHVDFFSEVSSASRLCDGALVLVDAVEGVCTQTITVLRQAWIERLKPILVINKIDRIITELRMSPIEAHHHLVQLVEQVNAVMGGFFASDRLEDEERYQAERAARLEAKKAATEEAITGDAAADATDGASTEQDHLDDEQTQQEEVDDEDLYFSPEKGDVMFASAQDGWAFRLDQFASMYGAKLGVKPDNLRRALWGDFFLDPKTKRVLARKHLSNKKILKPLFVQFVLDNLWAVYDAVSLNHNADKINKIVASLRLKVKPQDLRSKDPSALLQSILSQWLPIAPAAFRAIVDKVPDPPSAQRIRVPRMLHPELPYYNKAGIEPKNVLEEALYSAQTTSESPVVAYVSKLIAIPTADLPQYQRRQLTADEMRERGRAAREAAMLAATGAAPVTEASGADDASSTANQEDERVQSLQSLPAETLIGFARLYSGTLRKGQQLFCLLPKYDDDLPPDHPHNKSHITTVEVRELYMLMGRDLVLVEQVPAGNIFGIGGLEGKVVRSATLVAPNSEQLAWTLEQAVTQKELLRNLGRLYAAPAPIVRVALEPYNPSEMPKLVAGLKLLNQADPCVETLLQESGEHVIVTAGELHLERCIKDLQDRFAKIKIQKSPPIVPFRETAVSTPTAGELAPTKVPGAQRGTAIASVMDGLVTLTIRATPMSEALTEFLKGHLDSIKRLVEGRGETETFGQLEKQQQEQLSSQQLWSRLEELLSKEGPSWSKTAKNLRAFGPRGCGPNLLFDLSGSGYKPAWNRAGQQGDEQGQEEEAAGIQAVSSSSSRSFLESIDNAFHLASLRGPLCAEPMEGLAFFIEKMEVDQSPESQELLQSRFSQVTGSLITAGQEAFRNGLLDWSPRLRLAMYSCDIQASPDVLGRVHGVVARRHGRIVAEEMKESTTFFTIRALLPVVDSFGFAEEIRKRTSGAASPQLVFHGYELLDQDPFWVPTTEEELEDLGEKSDRENVAKKYMENVRKRKGLATSARIVDAAEKQRTLKK